MRRIVVFVSAVVVAVVLVSGAPGGGTGTGPSGEILYSDSKPHGGVPGIYLVRPASGAVTPLRGQFFHGSRPAWSPDGSKLVFERWIYPREDARSSRFGWDLVIATANGSDPRVLVAKTDRKPFPSSAVWSRDGRFIYFEDEEPSRTYVVRALERGRVRASKPARAAVPAPVGDTEAIRVDRGIAVRNRSTGSVRLVVRACRPPSHAPALGRPAWSPDGRWLAYVDCSHSDRNGFGSEIAIVRVDGSPWRIIVAHGRGLTAPSWREGI